MHGNLFTAKQPYKWKNISKSTWSIEDFIQKTLQRFLALERLFQKSRKNICVKNERNITTKTSVSMSHRFCVGDEFQYILLFPYFKKKANKSFIWFLINSSWFVFSVRGNFVSIKCLKMKNDDTWSYLNTRRIYNNEIKLKHIMRNIRSLTSS